MTESVSAKNGELHCATPEPRSAIINNHSMYSPSDDSLSPEDSASSVSANSVRAGREQRALGFGRPGQMRNLEKAYSYQTAIPYANSPVNIYANLASPQLGSPHGLGFNQLNMGLQGMSYAMSNGSQTPYDQLAMEFGLEPDLIAALAQRLGQSAISPQTMGSFPYASARM